MTRTPALVLTLAFVLLACGPANTSVAGFVTDIEAKSLTEVDSFTLRTPEGDEMTFRVGNVELDDGAFPVSHLREHMALGQGVAVAYRDEGSERVAYRLGDAPWLKP